MSVSDDEVTQVCADLRSRKRLPDRFYLAAIMEAQQAEIKRLLELAQPIVGLAPDYAQAGTNDALIAILREWVPRVDFHKGEPVLPLLSEAADALEAAQREIARLNSPVLKSEWQQLQDQLKRAEDECASMRGLVKRFYDSLMSDNCDLGDLMREADATLAAKGKDEQAPHAD